MDDKAKDGDTTSNLAAKQFVAALDEIDIARRNEAFVSRLMSIVGPMDRADLIDLGTGPANVPLIVASVRPSWSITAVDSSPEMISVAQNRMTDNSGRIRLLCDDMLSPSIPDCSYDIVVAHFVLHHVKSANQFWNQVSRIARPGAFVLVRDVVRPNSRDDGFAVVRESSSLPSIIRESLFAAYLTAFTRDEIDRQLATAGLNGLTSAEVSPRIVDVFGQCHSG